MRFNNTNFYSPQTSRNHGRIFRTGPESQSAVSNQQYPYIPNQHQPKEKAGCWGIAGSFLIPILGLILFFVQKDKVEDSKPYLYAGIAGFVVGLVLNFITMSFMH